MATLNMAAVKMVAFESYDIQYCHTFYRDQFL